MLKVNAHGIQGDAADGTETGWLVVANGNISTNPIVTGHQSHLVYHKVVY